MTAPKSSSCRQLGGVVWERQSASGRATHRHGRFAKNGFERKFSRIFKSIPFYHSLGSRVCIPPSPSGGKLQFSIKALFWATSQKFFIRETSTESRRSTCWTTQCYVFRSQNGHTTNCCLSPLASQQRHLQSQCRLLTAVQHLEAPVMAGTRLPGWLISLRLVGCTLVYRPVQPSELVERQAVRSFGLPSCTKHRVPSAPRAKSLPFA